MPARREIIPRRLNDWKWPVSDGRKSTQSGSHGRRNAVACNPREGVLRGRHAPVGFFLTTQRQRRSVRRGLEDIHWGKMLRKVVLAFSLELSFPPVDRPVVSR